MQSRVRLLPRCVIACGSRPSAVRIAVLPGAGSGWFRYWNFSVSTVP